MLHFLKTISRFPAPRISTDYSNKLLDQSETWVVKKTCLFLMDTEFNIIILVAAKVTQIF